MIKDNNVVQFDYLVKDDSGLIIDSSEGKDPLVYIHGTGAILFALENALTGKKNGESFAVKIAPNEGYGQRNEDLVQKVERSVFQDVPEVKEGMVFTAQRPEGDLQVTIIGIEGDEVTLDGNHPLAGKTLNFEGVIRDIRDATPEEIKNAPQGKDQK